MNDLRARIRTFLAATCEPLDPRWDPPSGVVHGGHDPDEVLAAAVSYQKALVAAGLAGLTVPEEFGGAGLDPGATEAFAEESLPYAVPDTMPLVVGLAMAVPTLLAHGSDEQKKMLIRPTLEADVVWCQLFSEPDAGSDLASLRTSATFADGRYRVRGQKVWSSLARHATRGLLLARTDAASQRHHGLTLFALPMASPGVEVRPLRDITGGNHFCEVFLDDVLVDSDAVIGEPGDGWRVAMSTLVVERRAPSARAGRPRWQRLIDLAAHRGRPLTVAERDALADLHVRERVLDFLLDRLDREGEARGWGGAAGSLAKVGRTTLEQRTSVLATTLLGARATAWLDGDVEANGTVQWALGARAGSIAAGTDEIQRNLIGERLLGLPAEPLAAR